MEGMKAIPYIALIVMISGVMVGSAIIALNGMSNTVTRCWNSSYTYNASRDGCFNNTGLRTNLTPVGQGDLNMTDEAYALFQAEEGQSDLAEQLPTVAVIGIMVIIISIIAGVFVYLRYFA